MNLKIAILEDKKNDYIRLSDKLQTWADLRGHELEICWFPGKEEILSCKQITDFSILFSDIELYSNAEQTTANGILVCTTLRQRGFSGEIIFLTAFKEYVFDGYNVQAFNYLLKPIAEAPLYNCMDRYCSIHFSDYYYLQTKEEVLQIPYSDIVAISRDGHDCILQTLHTIYVERNTLKNYEKKLPPYFIRCHKSCIINSFHIKALSGNQLSLSNNRFQPVGRLYLEDVRRTLIQLANDNLSFSSTQQ